MSLHFVLGLLVPVCAFFGVLITCICVIKCKQRFQYASDKSDQESPIVFQLHVKKALQQSGETSASKDGDMDRISPYSRTSSFLPTDERSREVGTQRMLVARTS
uniref:Uncharacterized protein n=1 Tax=Physcomitrium patens TaxID=3218 RepID=A0A2K1J486_PHYPA|nr:hypothetical protein PHYPA_022171 [Physcomitrium patens]